MKEIYVHSYYLIIKDLKRLESKIKDEFTFGYMEMVNLTGQECKKNIYISLKEKINLTVKEASIYSNIGETKIREMLSETACPFLLKIGNKNLVKRKQFEQYLENKHYL